VTDQNVLASQIQRTREGFHECSEQANVVFAGGSVVMAAAFGLMAESWWIFAVVLIALLAFHRRQRDIRCEGETPKAK
jgi:hypothetical protein